ncbi:hypothetical protein DPEC_G00370580 [Dallia pectoralis]|nr:hypothetical protein DPEC_G00370580 [Dallia pectoralis]
MRELIIRANIHRGRLTGRRVLDSRRQAASEQPDPWVCYMPQTPWHTSDTEDGRPSSRSSFHRSPFTNVGLDVFGPWTISSRRTRGGLAHRLHMEVQSSSCISHGRIMGEDDWGSEKILDSMFLQLGTSKLTHETLATLMAEVAAIINARPLIPVSTDPDDPLILTPATLLTQK